MSANKIILIVWGMAQVALLAALAAQHFHL